MFKLEYFVRFDVCRYVYMKRGDGERDRERERKREREREREEA